MRKKYLGPQSPCSSNNQWRVGSAASAAEPASLSPAGYPDNELVALICDLVNRAHGSWSGSAEELLEAGHAENRLIGITPQQVTCDIENLEDLLFEFDQIQHFSLKNSPKEAVRHVFLMRE